MITNTIIAAPLEGHARICPTLLVPQPRIDLLPDGAPLPRQFKIKTANGEARWHQANHLVQKRFAWRGYRRVALPSDEGRHLISLTALEGELTIGTLTITLDGPKGLSVEKEFAAEVAQLRAEGRKLSAYTRFAIDPTHGTKRVLAALFHVAYIVAHRIRGYDTALIEVNPRHVRYYERMLGGRVVGAERMNRDVNAPAVLLRVDFEHVREQIGRVADQPELACQERTLYPFAFALNVEAAIIERVRRGVSPRGLQVSA
jgi:hypothetical protein